jgi:hypothetical protein
MTTADDDNQFPAGPHAGGGKVYSGKLPPAVAAALEAQDIQALDLALRQMPRDEAEALAGWMVSVGLLVERTQADLDREQLSAYYPPGVAAALASGNVDEVYAALSELPPDVADRVYEQLQQQGLL